MNYDADSFLALLEEVERQGGVHLPDPCEPVKFRLKQPNGRGELKWKEVFTTGCRKDARFVLPYEPAARTAKERQAMLERGGGFATACAVDDDMGKWPRFAKAGIVVHDPETDEER